MRRISILNNLANLFWLIIGFLPVLIYWMTNPLSNWFYGFIIISIVIGNLPQRLIQTPKLSSNRKIYELFGIRLIRKFVQDGDYIRKGNGVIKTRAEAKRYVLRLVMYERFHVLCFSFFTFTMIHSIYNRKIIIALWILAANTLFNIYPILLQQYNRLRINKLQ